MGYWYGERHRVMEAVLANALDTKHPKQMEWCRYYFTLTDRVSTIVHPAGKLNAPSGPLDPAAGDDTPVDLST